MLKYLYYELDCGRVISYPGLLVIRDNSVVALSACITMPGCFLSVIMSRTTQGCNLPSI